MADSIYYSLKKLTQYPLALARKRKVMFFLFSFFFAVVMMFTLSDQSFTQTQKLCLVFTLLCYLFMGNRSHSSFFGQYSDYRLFGVDHGKKRCRKSHDVSTNLVG